MLDACSILFFRSIHTTSQCEIICDGARLCFDCATPNKFRKQITNKLPMLMNLVKRFSQAAHKQNKNYWQSNQQRNNNETVTTWKQNRITKRRESACVGRTLILTTDSRILDFLVNIQIVIEVCEFEKQFVFFFLVCLSVLCFFRHISSLLTVSSCVLLSFDFLLKRICYSLSEAHICVRLSFYFLDSALCMRMTEKE